MPSVAQILFLDALIGVLSHHLWFRKYEPTSYSTISATILLLTSPIVYALRSLVPNLFCAFVLAETTYLAAVLVSVVGYRLSPLHPLASCPGPLLCKVSKVWIAYVSWTGKLHRYYAELHEEYGSVVRIGPNELSITDKDLFPDILGAQGMPKGPVWDNRRIVTSRDAKGHRNLHAVRDLKLHSELRKPWNKAFAKEPMEDYEAAMVNTAQVLMEQLYDVCTSGESGEGVVVDAARWLSFYSFDFMGDMVFGRTFNFLKDGDPQGIWDMTQRSTIFPSVAQHIPWISGLTRLFPSLTKEYDAFRHFAAIQAKTRATNEPPHKDLFYHLINNTDVEPGVSALPLIMADAVLAIFAGSDTTSTTLSNIVYYLAKYPEWQERVRKEVDKASTSREELVIPDLPLRSVPQPDELAELKALNAVINETLRLQPAVPSVLQRAPIPQSDGSGGKQLGNLFLPTGNTVQVPPYAVHRDPRYFSPNPTQFWPERWLLAASDPNDDSSSYSRPLNVEGVILDRSAFIPFSTGPANCVGKALALKQLRYVVSLLVRNFKFEFANRYDGARWEERLEDRFLMLKGELPVRMCLRSQAL